jgi:8-oxo-dGTP diphosphatase
LTSIKQLEKRFRPYAAIFLILEKDGKTLLLKRQNTGFQDVKYSPITGHIDGNMTIAENAAREAMEEGGIAVKTDDLSVVFIAHQTGSDREYINFYLKADKWEGEPTNREPEFCSELSWYSVDNLPENIQKDVAFAFEKIKQNVFFAEFDWRKV